MPIGRWIPLIGSLAFATLSLTPAPAPASVAQVNSSFGCVTTTVTQSQAPTGPSMAAGGYMKFAAPIANTPAGPITSLYVVSGQTPVATVHQRVRACLIEKPDKDAACDPDKDSRGRLFLVVNLDAPGDDGAGVFTNSEHDCGGA